MGDLADDSTAEKIAARERREKAEKNAKDHQTCDKYVQKGLNWNVTVQFLLERLGQLGCPPPSGLIRCVDCGDKQAAGGFGVVEEVEKPTTSLQSKERESKKNCAQTQQQIDALLSDQRDGKAKLKLLPEIFLCQQHLRDETHAHEAMVHELIHAIDMCR
jgi:inner membrane protease ATP23